MLPCAAMKSAVEFLTPAEAAEVIGVSRQGFLKMVAKGRIAADLTTARQRFFSLAAVKKLKREREKAKKDGK